MNDQLIELASKEETDAASILWLLARCVDENHRAGLITTGQWQARSQAIRNARLDIIALDDAGTA